jgi:sugar O-acyltransferase (sialic acid O-acetyltransferase NeuD family)
MKTPLLLLGAGGHCRSCLEAIEAVKLHRVLGILDRAERVGDTVFGYSVVGTDADLRKWAGRGTGTEFLDTFGHIEDPDPRRRLFETARRAGLKPATLISPLASVSRHAQVGEGTVVLAGAVINAGARVGRNVIVNSQALIEHDSEIGDHAHIATRATVNGGCKVGAASFLGSGAVMVQGVQIVERCVVGALSLVRKDVMEPGRYAGIPLRRLL